VLAGPASVGALGIEGPWHPAAIGHPDQAAEPLVFHPPASETGCRGRVPPKPGWRGARPRLPEIGVETIKLVNAAAEWRRGLTKVAMSRSAGATGASVRVDVPSVDRKPPPTSTVERLLYLMTVAGLTPIAAIAKTKRQRLSRAPSHWQSGA
jgi:hypothetical protein